MKPIVATLFAVVAGVAVLTASETVDQVSFSKDLVPLLAESAPDSLQVMTASLDVSDAGTVVHEIRTSRTDTWLVYNFTAKPKGKLGADSLDLIVSVPWFRPNGVSSQIVERPPSQSSQSTQNAVTPAAGIDKKPAEPGATDNPDDAQ